MPPAPGRGFFTVTLHSPAVVPISAITAVIEVALVTEELTTPPPVSVTQVAPARTIEAPGSKPAPAIVTLVLVDVTVGTKAEGVTLVTPYGRIVNAAASTVVPPSGLTTVTLYVPAASVAPVMELVGCTSTVSSVALTNVAVPCTPVVTMPPVKAPVALSVLANFVPSVVFWNETVAPVTKPEPTMVTKVVTGGLAWVTGVAGVTVVIAEFASTTTPVAVVEEVKEPESSVTVKV